MSHPTDPHPTGPQPAQAPRSRGAHPHDPRFFGAEALPILRRATADLGWLLDRGYAQKASLKLVGDRYDLRQRQREAVNRSACGPEALAQRLAKRRPPEALAGAEIHVDGLNLLTSLEVALSGGLLLKGTDGVIRDMASMNGNYRKVHESVPAAALAGAALEALGARSVVWWLDQPVSNTGRLKAALYALAEAHGWDWQVHLVPDPDGVLIGGPAPVVSADSRILDEGPGWFDLVGQVIPTLAHMWLVDLSAETAG